MTERAIKLWREALSAYSLRTNPHDYNNAGTDLERRRTGDEAAAAIIEAALAEKDAEIAALREAGARLLEWWPEGSGSSLAGKAKGDGFAADLEAFRQALGAQDPNHEI